MYRASNRDLPVPRMKIFSILTDENWPLTGQCPAGSGTVFAAQILGMTNTYK